MARNNKQCFGSEVLKSPSSIYGAEVSAKWKRTHNGELIMTVKMPSDTVDSEVYIKTPRGHSGIQMDPWMSSTCRRKWSNHYTPNKVTKDKLSKFRQEKTHKHISLHRTAGRQQQIQNRCRSPRPNRRQNFNNNYPTVKQSQLKSDTEAVPRWRNHPEKDSGNCHQQAPGLTQS